MAPNQVVDFDGGSVTEINPFDDKSKIKVMVGMPSSGMIDCIAVDNRLDFMMEIARLEMRSDFKFFTGNTGRCGVNYAREMMAKEAINQGMDYILMIDDDQIVPRTMFERLYETLKKEDADIASPIVTQRLYPFYPVIYKHHKMDETGSRMRNEIVVDYEPNSVVVADGVGFGVVLISVPFLKKMEKALPDGMFFSNNNVGEDIYFCIKARQKFNAKIVVDTAIKVGHLRHPEMATEWDYVKAKNLQDKFKDVYPANFQGTTAAKVYSGAI